MRREVLPPGATRCGTRGLQLGGLFGLEMLRRGGKLSSLQDIYKTYSYETISTMVRRLILHCIIPANILIAVAIPGVLSTHDDEAL